MKNPKINIQFESKNHLAVRFKHIEITVNPLAENFGLKGYIANEKHFCEEQDKYVFATYPKVLSNVTQIFNSIQSAKDHICMLIMLSQAQYKLDGIFYKIENGVVYAFDQAWKESTLNLYKFRKLIQASKNCLVKPVYDKLFKAA